ncbi:hypothetical protein KTU01_25520 [Kocuria turfanensis]|uniref:Uncharacterized protein n=1 Tax=Kocuria turfanensis TaxID=388357 RepID=A0A512IFF2_9MICC|nr:hypothetical protein KTU01_25520 [Kocuria turfanensis]
MSPIALPRDPDAVLTVTNVSEGQRLIPDDVDLGGLSQVVAAVIDDEALLYGEFQVEAAAVVGWPPANLARWVSTVRCGRGLEARH